MRHSRGITVTTSLAALGLVGCPASWRDTEIPRPLASLVVSARREGDQLVIDYQLVNHGRDPIYAFVHPPQPQDSTTTPGDAAYVYFSSQGEVTVGLAPLFEQHGRIDAPLTGQWTPPVYSGAARLNPRRGHGGTVHLPLPLRYIEKYDGTPPANAPAIEPAPITKLAFEVAYMDWRDVDVADSYVDRGALYFHTLPDIEVSGPQREPARQSSNLYYASARINVDVPAELPPAQFRTSPPRPELPYPAH